MTNRRLVKDKLAQSVMLGLCLFSILMVVTIAVGLYLKSSPVLENKSLWSLLSSSEWRPMKGEFGFFP
ncbi:MAG: phosphate ABC transporter permease subunit PstC, partial [Bacteroidales bacterium]|nr:phosphate ABC transporter permease subunit PstC [Bacteroidales bacterium]